MTASSVGAPPAGAAPARQARVDPLAAGVFAVLVIACFAAFLITQRLKHTPSLVPVFNLTPNFAPSPRGQHKQEQISFKLAKADAVTATVLDAGGRVVATLLRDFPVSRYKLLSLRWSGHRGSALALSSERTASGRAVLVPALRGPLAPAGEYRVRLHLRRQDRTVESRRAFQLIGG